MLFRDAHLPLLLAWVLWFGAADELSDFLACDFEYEVHDVCQWSWNASSVFQEGNASTLRLNSNYRGPYADAEGNAHGRFLYLQLTGRSNELHVWSLPMSHTRSNCRLEVFFAMANMSSGSFKLVVETTNGTSWLTEERPGNNKNTWEKFTFKVGRVKQEFRAILEISPSDSIPAHVLMDNIRLVDCFHEKPSYLPCSSTTFPCSNETDCINRTQVCDIVQDCYNGEDEKQNCDIVPVFARCTFEDGWCGWENSPTSPINWTRQNGTASTKTRITGPAFDHTFQNFTGMYLYVNMSTMPTTKLGASAILESAVIKPPPKYHSNPSSPYYKTCFIRFYYHQFGPNIGSLALYLNERDKMSENKVTRLWFTSGDKDDRWLRQIVSIPTNITNLYILQFEARRGLRARGDIAIDDVSMSPECFGLNVPPNATEGYVYKDFSGYPEPTVPPIVHNDFINKPVYYFSSCRAKGQFGPTPDNCSSAYNNTSTNVTVLEDAGLMGVQKWVVPEDGYYTIIARGAGGGRGSDAAGISQGATAMGVIRLNKTQQLFIIVGQEGSNACHKNFALSPRSSCEVPKKNTPKSPTVLDAIAELKVIDVFREGGGGGGASVVYLWSKSKGRIPLVIAGGGGGLGGGQLKDDGHQHGAAMEPNRQGITGAEHSNVSAGAGGGWLEMNGTREVTGKAIMLGAQGGYACGKSGALTDTRHGVGGFGGGGGGCKTGGGGGGFAGGNSMPLQSPNGFGGTSYVSQLLITSGTTAASSVGPGAVVIIPAVKGCHCHYRCVVLDENRSRPACVCQANARLMENGVDCEAVSIPADIQSDRLITWTVMAIMGFLLLCILLFLGRSFYLARERKKLMNLNKASEIDVQLNRLRVTSDSMITEYNPNYEFCGGNYTINDLPHIPRDSLRTVKALGQGAFGEVYQGFYRCRSADIVEMPVAVKSLPELSTNQAETDFLMEALIMSKFSHPNIVHFIGVCFDRHPRFIVLELLAGGDLKNFLRESRPKPERPSPLNMKDLIMCAIDVAKACLYLEEHRFIHRDIAARNCLLTTKGPGRTCKIADFGMSRDIYRSEYYKKGGKAMLPIKWMPPEAFQDGLFTAKTDVWSFGVLLWEIMSLGYMPYTGCGNREVMNLVISGGRLEPPCNCPEPIYALMSKCWCPIPEERPSFSLILERLGYCVQDPDVLNMPLPIFNWMSWSDRDTIGTQSEGAVSPARVSGDYLEPNIGVVTPESTKSVEGWRGGYSSDNSLAEPLLQETTAAAAGPATTLATNNNNNNNRRPLSATLSLDASTLTRQPIPFGKHNPKLVSNLSETSNTYTVPTNGRIPNETEISC